MKKLSIVFILMTIIIPIFAQSEINNIITEEMNDEEMLLGHCDREGLNSDPFNMWFEPEYESYELDIETLDQLSAEPLDNVHIKIVLGTWCGDSQREVPRFYKIMDYLDFTDFKVIAVNRLKRAEGTDVDELNINFVPTFIFYYKGDEIGRIIESPEVSLESDLVKIVSSI